MPEWSNGAVSKTVDLGDRVLGFESLSLRKLQNPVYFANTQGFMFINHGYTHFSSPNLTKRPAALKNHPKHH